MVKDIWPGHGGSLPASLTDVGGTLFFSADDGDHGSELWRSDGTEAGTVMVKDIRPGVSRVFPGDLTDVRVDLFFDGRRRHARPRALEERRHRGRHGDGEGHLAGPVSSDPDLLTASRAHVFFAADDGTHGGELWKSDGTDAGTVMVKDINPGPYRLRLSDANSRSSETRSSSRRTTESTDGSCGAAIGTESGTVLVKEIGPGAMVAALEEHDSGRGTVRCCSRRSMTFTGSELLEVATAPRREP